MSSKTGSGINILYLLTGQTGSINFINLNQGHSQEFHLGGGINFKSFQFQNQQQFVLGQREKKQPVTT